MVPVGGIRFENVSKQFHITQRATPRLGAWLISKVFEYFRREEFNALQDISFTVEPGEMIGLLGHNGAGKSTILKLIAGISQPTSGSVSVNGNVASLLELGVGFHEELTGMENIFYNGAMLGMSKARIMERLETIINFSGLVDFIYEPIKHYSSGMYSRLACAVALHLDPQIILVDEILAVGDAEFQQRGIMKMLELHDSGVTVVLVTHETATARDLCNRLIWIERGKLIEDGDPRSIHTGYMKSMFRKTLANSLFDGDIVSSEKATARLTGIRITDPAGSPIEAIETGDPARVEIDLVGSGRCRLGLLWRWTDGRVLAEDFSPVINLSGEETLGYDIPRWPMIRSQIEVSAILLNEDSTEVWSRTPALASVSVETPDFPELDVLVRPVAKWNLRRLSPLDTGSPKAL